VLIAEREIARGQLEVAVRAHAEIAELEKLIQAGAFDAAEEHLYD